MGVLFEDGFLDGFGTWPLAYIPYGGPDFGELAAVGRRSETATLPPITQPGSRQGTGRSRRQDQPTMPATSRAHKSCT